jgi:hypothetical protein
MRKAALTLATVATLGVTAVAAPAPAEARGGFGPGLAGGLIRCPYRRPCVERLRQRNGYGHTPATVDMPRHTTVTDIEELKQIVGTALSSPGFVGITALRPLRRSGVFVQQ